jgi:hypothetical protein
MQRTVASMRNTYSNFVGKLQGKISLGRRRRSWNNNIKMDVNEEVVRVQCRLV